MPDELRIGEWVVRPDLNLVVAGTSERRVEPKAMDVLVYLARHEGAVVSKRELIGRVWDGTRVVDGVLARCVSQLRKALGDDPRAPRFIETVARRGYRLLPQVREQPSVVKALGLAILPFVNLSGDATQAHVTEALAELIGANLAMLGGLRVTSRTSAARCHDARATLPEIAAQLRVDYAVEGSALRAPGGELRAIVKLVDARADTSVWVREYRHHYDALLAVAAEVARAIAGELRVGVPAGVRLVTESSSTTPRANDAYVRGLYALSKRTPDDMRLALRLFQESVERDPTFALGYTGAGLTSAIMGVYALLRPEEAFDAAGPRRRRRSRSSPTSARPTAPSRRVSCSRTGTSPERSGPSAAASRSRRATRSDIWRSPTPSRRRGAPRRRCARCPRPWRSGRWIPGST